MKFLLKILVLFCISESISTKRRFFKFLKLECLGYEPYFKVSVCKLRPINRYNTLLFLEFSLNKIYKNGKVSYSYKLR